MANRNIHFVAQSIMRLLNEDDPLAADITQLMQEYDMTRRSSKLNARYTDLSLSGWMSLHRIVTNHCTTNSVMDRQVLHTLYAA